MMVNFDPTVNMGQVAVGVSFLITLVTMFTNMRADVKSLAQRIEQSEKNSAEWRAKVDKELEKQTEVLVTLGKQDERMHGFDRQIADVWRRLDAHAVVTGAIAASRRED